MQYVLICLYTFTFDKPQRFTISINPTTTHSVIRSHNTEKVIYYLLLERKRRRPALEDEDEAVVRPRHVPETNDPPKKRLDTCRLNGQNFYHFGQISHGSPTTMRRNAYK